MTPSPDLCWEEVADENGDAEPCHQPTVTWNEDPDGGDPYPVCARHVRRYCPQCGERLQPDDEGTLVCMQQGTEKRRPMNREAYAARMTRAFYVAEATPTHGREWAEMAWDDMGGSEPSDERALLEIHMLAAFDAVAADLWDEGKRDALNPIPPPLDKNGERYARRNPYTEGGDQS